VCCKYPTLVIWKHQLDDCVNFCEDSKEDGDKHTCCIKICILKELGVLLFSTDPNMKPQVDHKGLSYSFLLSVGNDTSWEPIIRSSTSRCFDDRFGFTDGYQCDVIPLSLFEVITCCYKENFLKCPNYNPKRVSGCKATYEFIELCYVD
jgi:hypothetical protein